MLSLERVSLELARRSVLRNISVTFHPGETVAVIGRNGAGKTSLLRAIMGVAPLSAGCVRFDGVEIQSRPAHGRANLGFGYAPEDRAVLPTMSVLENLRLPCEVAKMHESAIGSRLDRVLHIVPQLKTMLDRSGAMLSGGQAKMVALGRALMIGTRVVLLDEPFQGLAPALAEQYGGALRALREADPGLCVVVTESNAALLKNVQSRSIYLERGEISIASPMVQSSSDEVIQRGDTVATCR